MASLKKPTTIKKGREVFRSTGGKYIPSDIAMLSSIALPPNANALLAKSDAELRLTLGPNGFAGRVVNSSNKVIGGLEDLRRISRMSTILSREGKVSSQAERQLEVKTVVTNILLSRGELDCKPFDVATIATCLPEAEKLKAIGKFKEKLELALLDEKEKLFLTSCSAIAESVVGDKIVSLMKGTKQTYDSLLEESKLPKAIFAKATGGNEVSSADKLLYGNNFTKAGFFLSFSELRDEVLMAKLIDVGFVKENWYYLALCTLDTWIDPGKKAELQHSVNLWVPPPVITERHCEALQKGKVTLDFVATDGDERGRARCFNSIVQQAVAICSLNIGENVECLSEITGEKLVATDLAKRGQYLRLKEKIVEWNGWLDEKMSDRVVELMSRLYKMELTVGAPKKAPKKVLVSPEPTAVEGTDTAPGPDTSGPKPAPPKEEWGAIDEVVEAIDEAKVQAFIASHSVKTEKKKKKRAVASLTAVPKKILKDIKESTMSDSAQEELISFLTGFSSTEILEAAYNIIVSNISALYEGGSDSEPDSDEDST